MVSNKLVFAAVALAAQVSAGTIDLTTTTTTTTEVTTSTMTTTSDTTSPVDATPTEMTTESPIQTTQPITTTTATTAMGSCVPTYEEYICDDDYGSEYYTTFTIYPSGCPSSTYNSDYPTSTAGSYPTSTEDCEDEGPTGYPTGSQPTGGAPNGWAPWSSVSGGGPTGGKPSGGYPTGSSAPQSPESWATYQPPAQSSGGKSPATTVPTYGSKPTSGVAGGSSGAAGISSTKSGAYSAATSAAIPTSKYTGAAPTKKVDSVAMAAFGLIGILVAV